MFTLRLDCTGGFKSELTNLSEEEVIRTLSHGMAGARPYEVVVNGEVVSWEAFRAIFQMGYSNAAEEAC